MRSPVGAAADTDHARRTSSVATVPRRGAPTNTATGCDCSWLLVLAAVLVAGMWLAMPEALSGPLSRPDMTGTLRSSHLVAPLACYLRRTARAWLSRWTRPASLLFKLRHMLLYATHADVVVVDVIHLLYDSDQSSLEEVVAWLTAVTASLAAGSVRLVLRGRGEWEAPAVAWDELSRREDSGATSWLREWSVTQVTYAHMADAAVSCAGVTMCLLAGAMLLGKGGLSWAAEVVEAVARSVVLLLAGVVSVTCTADLGLPACVGVTFLVLICVDSLLRWGDGLQDEDGAARGL